MIGYILPTGDGRRVLWFPGPRITWGHLKGLTNKMTLLTPSLDVDVDEIPMMSHDYIFRPVMRVVSSSFYRWLWVGRLMLWGAIWLLGMDSPLEDTLGGIYLLLGLPFFIRLTTDVSVNLMRDVAGRFGSIFYSPEVELQHSPRLEELEKLVTKKPSLALTQLDRLGLQHLREFYKRVAWQERWEITPPTGQGVVKNV